MSSEMEKLLLEEEKNYQEVYKGSIVRGTVMIEKADSFYIDLNYKTALYIKNVSLVQFRNYQQEQTNFEKGKPISTNADRTLKRSARRNLDRYQLRRENLIEVEGYYTQFNCGDLVDKVDLLKSLEV